jgi:hypothetical protein
VSRGTSSIPAAAASPAADGEEVTLLSEEEELGSAALSQLAADAGAEQLLQAADFIDCPASGVMHVPRGRRSGGSLTSQAEATAAGSEQPAVVHWPMEGIECVPRRRRSDRGSHAGQAGAGEAASPSAGSKRGRAEERPEEEEGVVADMEEGGGERGSMSPAPEGDGEQQPRRKLQRRR